MEIKEMNLEQIEERLTAIQSEMTAEDADIDALTSEVDELEARKAEIEAQIEKRAALEARVMKTGVVVKDFKREEPKEMTNMEIRNTPAYIDAYVNYLKTENDAECRALLTENVEDGIVPVPEMLESGIRTAWENDEIMSRVRRSTIKGNVRIGFEVSADPAVIHTEGAQAPTEEELVLGTIVLVPQTVKKWISVSDEVLDLTGTEFLDFVIDEIVYQIVKKTAAMVIAAIDAAPAVTSAAAGVGVAPVEVGAITMTTISEALAKLSDEAASPVIVMNRGSLPAFEAIQLAGNYAADIFKGLPRVYTSALKSYDDAAEDETFAIVGDLNRGVLANYPNGVGVRTKVDETTLATEDLVRIIGRQPVAIGVVQPGALAKLVKGAAEAEGGEGGEG